MTPKAIIWPKLTQLDTMELPILTLFWCVGCYLLGSVFKVRPLWVYSLVAAPWLMTTGVCLLNELRRLIWLRGFDRVAAFRQLKPKLTQYPEKYRFQFVTYSGFDRRRLRPAIVLDDLEADKQIAIYPGSWKVVADLRRLGITETNQQKVT